MILRLTSALFTSKYGFSVVAPISMTVPSSTYGKSASCCALLKRCISSINKIVRFPLMAMVSFAFSTMSVISFLPAVVAFICRNSPAVVFAITWASVVFPVPGGPYKIMEESLSAVIDLYKRVFLPIICS